MSDQGGSHPELKGTNHDRNVTVRSGSTSSASSVPPIQLRNQPKPPTKQSCLLCNLHNLDPNALQSHLKGKKHHRAAYSVRYCHICKKHFPSSHPFQTHLNRCRKNHKNRATALHQSSMRHGAIPTCSSRPQLKRNLR